MVHSAVERIHDRLSADNGRIIDLSRTTRTIGPLRTGPVRLEVVE